MKRWLVLLFAIIFSLPSFGQESTDTKWTLSIDFGIQAHDKRLFGFPPFPSARLLEEQPETFGTFQAGISTVRKILQKGRFEIFAGGGLSSELSTFKRPFDLDFGKEFKRDILIMTNRYYQNLLQFPIKSKFRIGEKFNFSLDVLPQFNFLTIADNTKDISYSWWMFDFYSLEVNPGLSYDIGRFEFGLKYRAFQVKKIDKILFSYSTISDPRTDQVFETYNPFKLWFSVGYKL
jgi:hypothetical protein